MKISFPPQLHKVHINFDTYICIPDSYHLLRGCIENIYKILVDEHFEDRYLPRFDWFTDYVRVESILNFGCSRRETLALMWYFNAKTAIGVDKSPNKISDANRLVNLIKAAINLHLPKIMDEIRKVINTTLPNHYSDGLINKAKFDELLFLYEEYLEKLNEWTKENLPDGIKNLQLPEYSVANISDDLEAGDRFDLIYGRCVLYIAEDSGDDVYATARNIAGVLNPAFGRIVIVEPKTFKGKTYDFKQPFLKAGLELVMEISNDELGGNEINERDGDNSSELAGYIFRKPNLQIVSYNCRFADHII